MSGDKLSESVGESRGIGGVRPREGKRELFAPVATHDMDLADVVLDETRISRRTASPVTCEKSSFIFLNSSMSAIPSVSR